MIANTTIDQLICGALRSRGSVRTYYSSSPAKEVISKIVEVMTQKYPGIGYAVDEDRTVVTLSHNGSKISVGGIKL